MSKNINEKIVDISGETPITSDEQSTQKMPSRRNKKTSKKKKASVISNILTVIAVLGILGGGGILVKTLWEEYTRAELTKTFIGEAVEKVKVKIPREEFNPNEGDVVGVIIFPERDNLEVPLIEGIRESDMHAGIGHDPRTGWPKDQRQIFLAGHRNTEFGILKDVTVGETVIIDTLYGKYTYKIVTPPNDNIPGENIYAGKVVKATQTDVINYGPAGTFENDQLVLMTCYPFTFGASLEDRFLIYAERVA